MRRDPLRKCRELDIAQGGAVAAGAAQQFVGKLAYSDRLERVIGGRVENEPRRRPRIPGRRLSTAATTGKLSLRRGITDNRAGVLMAERSGDSYFTPPTSLRCSGASSDETADGTRAPRRARSAWVAPLSRTTTGSSRVWTRRSADSEVPECEQDATRAMVGGNYGMLRNPAGHRQVDYADFSEAAESFRPSACSRGS